MGLQFPQPVVTLLNFEEAVLPSCLSLADALEKAHLSVMNIETRSISSSKGQDGLVFIQNILLSGPPWTRTAQPRCLSMTLALAPAPSPVLAALHTAPASELPLLRVELASRMSNSIISSRSVGLGGISSEDLCLKLMLFATPASVVQQAPKWLPQLKKP